MEDDVPQLSAETFSALQEFYAEQQKREQIIHNLERGDELKNSNIIFDENWQLSQFWYDDETIQSLVKVVEGTLSPKGNVALISCPTLFVPIKRHVREDSSVTLFEYDRRFEVHGENFVLYDYNYPYKFPRHLDNTFDIVIADPPFLSEECLLKTLETVKLLAKDKIILCTGAVMKKQVEKSLNLKIRGFQPHHRNNLANEFSCYANFDLDAILSRKLIS